MLSLLSVLVQPRCGCPSGEAIDDDQVQWYWVVTVGLLLLHEQELEILFCNLSCRRDRCVVVKSPRGSGPMTRRTKTADLRAVHQFHRHDGLHDTHSAQDLCGAATLQCVVADAAAAEPNAEIGP